MPPPSHRGQNVPPGHDPDADARWMLRAIRLARRGAGCVEPNPMVGCVIVRRGRAVGEGYHRRFGGPHAEVHALSAAGGAARGATAYVSLEPCRHHGKTPPCTDALIAAEIARVVVGTPDPHDPVNGRGIRRLRRAGIRVDVGVCAERARELIAPFTTVIRARRPYVLAKWAQTLDGKLATRTGDSRWISSERSRHRVHQLRARVDAILVGARTVIVDDPLLTARGVRVRRVATRVVLDTRLRIPIDGHLVRTADSVPVLVFTGTRQARSDAARRLARRGVEVVGCGSRGDRVDPRAALRRLARRGATNVLVEGGASVLTSFLTAGCVDEAFVYIAPIWVGGADAPCVSLGRPAERIAGATRPARCDWRRSGGDILAHLTFAPPV